VKGEGGREKTVEWKGMKGSWRREEGRREREGWEKIENFSHHKLIVVVNVLFPQHTHIHTHTHTYTHTHTHTQHISFMSQSNVTRQRWSSGAC